MDVNPPPAVNNRAVHITLIGVGAFALLLFAFLGTVLWQNPTITTLQCERARNTCSINWKMQNGTRSWSLPLSDLVQAHVVYPKLSHRGRGGATYAVYLRSSHEDDWFTTYDSLPGATSAASSINAFLADTGQARFAIEHDESVMNTLAWVVFILMPLFIIGMLTFAWRKLPTGT